MNATDAHDYVVKSFAELLETLRADDRREDTGAKIRANTRAREAAQNRVWREYLAIGCTPPHPDALSITARRELGYPLPMTEAAE